MSQRPNGLALGNDPEQAICEYLRSHSDFFSRHLELLDSLYVPHPVGSAVSLVERQVQQLREQNNDLRKKLHDLVKIARDNDCLSQRMQRLSLALIEAKPLDELLHGIQSVLREEFQADFTAIRLTAHAVEPKLLGEKERLDAAALPLFEPLFQSGKPMCGRLTLHRLRLLFDDAAPRVASLALLPLSGMGWKGLLAIGSLDNQRFYPGMGTLFLSRISELISHALEPHLYALEAKSS